MDDCDNDYVCSLSEKWSNKAQLELNEDPKNRLGAVQTLRKWVLEQPHIKCPVDTKFLLAFLRGRKFSQLASRTLLENYLKSRKEFAHWFQACNVGDAAWNAIIDSGTLLVLPGVDDHGQTVIMLRSDGFETSGEKYTKDDMCKVFVGVFDCLLRSEEYQVNGLVEVVDMTNSTVKQLTFISLEDRKNFIVFRGEQRNRCEIRKKNYPTRIKRIHVYNPGVFIDGLITIVKFVMSEKLQKRVVNHSSNLESLYEHVPLRLLPTEYLPDDYKGPTNGSIDDIKGKWIG